jgi:hypothetical protein
VLRPLSLHLPLHGPGELDRGQPALGDHHEPRPAVVRIRYTADVAGALQLVHQEAGGLLRHLRLLGQVGQACALGADPLEDASLRDGDVVESRRGERAEDPRLHRAVREVAEQSQVDTLDARDA